MKIALRDHRGKYGGTWDGPGLVFDRDRVGAGETFDVVFLDVPITVPPLPPPDPPGLPEPDPSVAYVHGVKRWLEAQGVSTSGVEGAFNVTKRVAWGLRDRLGLLRKDGGENIVTWRGRSFSAGRVCYPDGRIFKIMTDVGGENGPTWADNGTVDPDLFVPAMDPKE